MAKSWYVLRTRTGEEGNVKSAIEDKIKLDGGLNGKIEKVLLPTEKIMGVTKDHHPQTRERLFFPGYILVYMEMDNETYWFTRNIAGVFSFLGDELHQNRQERGPIPISEEEVKKLIQLDATAAVKPRPVIQFEKGQTVRITQGPFSHFVGVVEEINEDRSRLKAMVTIFGRPTPVELGFDQVEKV